MFLKQLTCEGFKSFADRIVLNFERGVTGIVGPNGCGKSNVVDAIKWVLGDQSAKSLRGDLMQDVIFFGSGTRKSAGFAQVDLTFDNTDRALAFEADDVTITRRLYRTGESEYLLNNEDVRLKDVKDLLRDTGMGISGYSVVEQGKVTFLIQANAEQRRVVFEEAAGISKYKARKKEAERKLLRVEQNLLRLEDIIDEVERRLRSIKYQAGKARSWQLYDRQLREKRATYSLAEYHRLSRQSQSLRTEADRLSDEVTRLRTEISETEARESQLRNKLDVLEAERQDLQRQVLATVAEVTEKRERIEQSGRQMDMLLTVQAREQERLAGERQRAFRQQKDIESAEREMAALQERLSATHAEQDRLAGEDAVLAREMAGLEARGEEEKAGIIELARRMAQLHNQVESLESERRRLQAEKERLVVRQQQVQNELAETMASRAARDRRAHELAGLIEDLSARIEQKQQEAERLGADQAELSRQLASAKEHRSGMLSRKHTLEDLERNLEGVDAGVRELLHRKEQDSAGQSFGYVWGMVADLIAADVSHAALIETALGEYDQYLVVGDSGLLIADVQVLADCPGRIPTICLDRLPAFIDGRDFSQQEGFVARAMDLVRYESHCERLVKHLLGHTIIVRSLADAVRMAEQNPPMYQYVTLSGELLDPQGICQLGPAGGRAGLISRKSELREIDAQIAEVDGRIADMSGRLEQASAEAARLQIEQHELRNARADARTAEAENNAARQATQNVIDRLTRSGPEISAEIEAVELRMGEAVRQASDGREALARLEKDNADRQQRIDGIQVETGRLRQERLRLGDLLTRAKVQAAELAQRRSSVGDRLRELRAARQASEEAVRVAAHEVEQAATRITLAERTILGAQTRLADLYADKERLDRLALDRGRLREQIAAELEDLAGTVRRDRTLLEEVEVSANARQMDLRECTIRVEDLCARVRDDLNINLAEAYTSYEHQDQDWAVVEAEIEDLKAKIQRLGNVNLDAIAEQEELEQRSGFLGGQRDDLRNAKNQLEELIEQLNVECRERFVRTFEAVRGNFNEMFRKLFGGGKADLMFEQPPEGQPLDVLEAGIEIMARPPGKELRTNSLLSGGEKTMTAIALLMAIFKSRPSPFALLDEVDAALDEANNERFNRIVQEFLDRTQFVIITHQKPTMSIADVLYGITMQEAGVSKKVSVKFDTGRETAVA
ncbi:MAG TPA: chromosome segregation protein SMC [Phycisphaerae bacterium]|nr:chromosome segregation protein SMC [Phycisphaerae bacterium]